MRQKTILQVLPSLVSGGVETGTLDLAQALVKQGYRSLVVSSGGPMVKALEQQGSKHIEFPVHSKNPILMWWNSRKLAKLIKTQKVDLIHARSRAPAWSALWASKQSNIPFVTTFHGVYGHHNALKRWYNSAMLRSQHVIAVSKFVQQHIEEVYPTFNTKTKLIFRGIDLDRFELEEAQLAAKQLKTAWSVPEGKNIIMLPGRLTRIKGHQVLIEALAKLPHRNFYCLFVGDEPGKDAYKQELEALIAEKGLQAHVKLTGNFDNMPAAYALADLVISASVKPESFGRTACEAQVMQRMVVATNHGGSQETISPPYKSLMCKPRDSSSMAAAIERALAYSKDERTRQGIEAAAFVKENFSLSQMCRDTIALYELELS